MLPGDVVTARGLVPLPRWTAWVRRAAPILRRQFLLRSILALPAGDLLSHPMLTRIDYEVVGPEITDGVHRQFEQEKESGRALESAASNLKEGRFSSGPSSFVRSEPAGPPRSADCPRCRLRRPPRAPSAARVIKGKEVRIQALIMVQDVNEEGLRVPH